MLLADARGETMTVGEVASVERFEAALTDVLGFRGDPIGKIEAALKRIEDGSYGYCEETEEPIGIRRLEARPIATLSIEAQERHERRERAYREE